MRTALLAASLFAVVYAQTGSTPSAGTGSVGFALTADGSGTDAGGTGNGVTPSTHANDRSTHPGIDATGTANDQSSLDTSMTMSDMTGAGTATETTISSVTATSARRVTASSMAPFAAASPTIAPPSIAISGTASAVKVSSSVSGAKPSVSTGPTAATAAGYIDGYNGGAIGFALLGAALFAF
ncbi:hypothetical protein CspHIS471_0202640 [Cutaneotrichosporon sp. HIS471]|nr:hypothetical protein CspHIS471_0202640 [Cutaneotrichosporon sp. HIS471]